MLQEFLPHHGEEGLEYRGTDGRKVVYSAETHKWVLKDASGLAVDFDSYRYDLAERNQIQLKHKV